MLTLIRIWDHDLNIINIVSLGVPSFRSPPQSQVTVLCISFMLLLLQLHYVHARHHGAYINCGHTSWYGREVQIFISYIQYTGSVHDLTNLPC